MAITSRLKASWSALFGRSPGRAVNVATSGLANPESWLLDAILGHMSRSGVRVTPDRALGVATVFACVNVIARTISTIPVKVHRRTANGGQEEATDHPLNDLLKTAPNDEMTTVEFRAAMQVHLTLRQNAYAQIRRNGYDRPIELIPIQPKDVQIIRTPGGRLNYKVQGLGQLDSQSILHLKGFTFDGLVGQDVVRLMNDVIGLAIALEDNASLFFQNGSRPGLVMEMPGQLSDPAAARLKASIEEKTRGGNAHTALLLEEGLKLSAAARVNNDSAQFDETRDRQDRHIARVFNVPPNKIGLVNSEPRANVEQQNIDFVVNTILPYVVGWEQSLNQKLLTPAERETYFVKFDLRGLLRGDMAGRFDSYTKARQWGWMTINEIRALEDMNPVEGGDDIFVGGNAQQTALPGKSAANEPGAAPAETADAPMEEPATA